jgi:hypothetical protein
MPGKPPTFFAFLHSRRTVCQAERNIKLYTSQGLRRASGGLPPYYSDFLQTGY